MSLKRILFSGLRKFSSLMRAVTFFAPRFFARIAQTMFISCVAKGYTETKRSAFWTPALFRISIEEGLPTMVAASATERRWAMRAGSLSMTVTSPPSWPSIFARWEPTSPAPTMTIFILRRSGI